MQQQGADAAVDAVAQKRCQCLYFCTSKASTFVLVKHVGVQQRCADAAVEVAAQHMSQVSVFVLLS